MDKDKKEVFLILPDIFWGNLRTRRKQSMTYKQSCMKVLILLLLVGFIPLVFAQVTSAYEPTISIKDFDGKAIAADIIVKDASDTIIYDSSKAVEVKQVEKQVEKGTELTADVILKEGDISKIAISGLADDSSIVINIDKDVDNDFIKSYAIDPSLTKFESALITATAAQGTSLVKCAEWNFETRTCSGSWVKIQNLVYGEEYSFTITPTDPAFGEINLTESWLLDESKNRVLEITTEVIDLDGITYNISSGKYAEMLFDSNSNAVQVFWDSKSSNNILLNLFDSVWNLIGTKSTDTTDSFVQFNMPKDTLENHFYLLINGSAEDWLNLDWLKDPPVDVFYDNFNRYGGSGLAVGNGWEENPALGWSSINNVATYCFNDASNDCIAGGAKPNGQNVTRNISTQGYTNITINQYGACNAMEAGDSFEVWAYNGTVYNSVKSFTIGTTAECNSTKGQQLPSIALSSEYKNLATFKIQYKCYSDGGEACYLDNFNLSGTPYINISDVNTASTTNQTANINWYTEVIANGTVNYGLTTALGTNTSNTSYINNRTISLIGLTNNTLYYYNVTSCYNVTAYCETSGVFNFTTNQTIGDVTIPNITGTSPNQSTTTFGQNITINANVTDDVAVSNVWATFWDGAVAILTKFLAFVSGNTYSTTITINESYPSNTTYTIYANDTTNNNATPVNGSFLVSACYTPSVNLTINSNTTLCSGTYNINYGMIVNASNIVIQCNNTLINGTRVAGSKGFNVANQNNVIIQNCSVSNYEYGVYINNASNTQILNNTIAPNVMGLICSGSQNVTINNNWIADSQKGSGEASLRTSCHNSSITNNLITLGFRGIDITGGQSNFVYNNTLLNETIGINSRAGASYNNYSSNFIDGDVNIGAEASTSLYDTFTNNILYGYMNLLSSTGISLLDNVFNGSSAYLVISSSDNTSVIGNSFNNLNIYNTAIQITGTSTGSNITGTTFNNITKYFSSTATGDNYISEIPILTITNGVSTATWSNVTGNYNANGVLLKNSSLSINSTLNPSLNKTANLSIIFTEGVCPVKVYYYNQFTSNETDIFANGQICKNNTNPACTNMVCDGNRVNFTVPHFDSYGANGTLVLPNITSIYPNATNEVQSITDEINVSISIRGKNQTFNITTNVISPLTYTWYLNNIQQASTINSFTNLFDTIGQHNVTIVVNDTTDNDSFTWFVNVPCVEPYNGMKVNTTNLFCDGTYTLPNGINVTGSNIIISGNNTILNGSGAKGFDLYYLNNVTITGMTINSFTNAIYSSRSHNISIENNVINICGDGIYATEGGFLPYLTNFNVKNNNISSCSNCGMFLIRPTTSSIDNNILNNNGVCGIYLTGVGAYDDSYTNITNNIVQNTQRGIVLDSIKPLIVGNNQLINVSDKALEVSRTGSSLINNSFSNNAIDIYSYPNVKSLFKMYTDENILTIYDFINITNMNNLYINDSIVAINISAEPIMNVSANVSFTVSSCSLFLYYNNDFYKDIGSIPTYSLYTNYSNKVCDGTTMNFTTSHFSTIFASTDITIPIINSTEPNQTIVNVGQNITINATVTDNVAVDSVWITIWNGITGIFTGLLNYITGNVYSIEVQTNDSFATNTTYTIYANDTSGNNATPVNNSFLINRQSGITLISPDNDTQINNTQTIQFNYVIIDDISTTLSCDIYLDNVLNQTNSSVINGTSSQFTINNITYGSHTWQINCTDGMLSNVSETRTFVIADTIKPSVFDIKPTTGTTYSINDIVTISTNVTDSIAVDKVYATLTYPNTTTQQLSLIKDGATNKYNNTFIITIPTGQIDITFTANDTSNNINNTEQTYITIVDISNPSVSTITPTSVNEDIETNYEATVTDNVAVTSCNLYIDNVNYGSMDINANIANKSMNITTPDTYEFVANCSDAIGNYNDTSITSVTINDTTKPDVSTIQPTTAMAGVSITYSANYSDNVAVTSCNLVVNGTVIAPMILNAGIAYKPYLTTNTGYYDFIANCSDAAGNYNDASVTSVQITPFVAPICRPLENNFIGVLIG